MIEKNICAYDFFDTIVHRNCHPEKVLYQWSKEISRVVDFKISPSHIYQLRKEAEYSLKAQDNVEEPKYTELIKNIFAKIQDEKIEWVRFFNYCYECELKIELSHLNLDSECIRDIKKQKEKGNIVIIVSDFYLGKDFIRHILKEFHIEDLFSEVFVSCDLNKRKSSGNLYQFILSYFKIEPNHLYMQGDNYKSDVLIPQRLGINSTYRKYKDTFNILNRREFERKIKQIQFSNPRKNALSGYAGELVYFISDLYKQLCIEGVTKVLFCSREGQLLKKLFDEYQLKIWGEKTIESIYFYVSRKATILPSLTEFSKEEFRMIFRQFDKLKIRDFLNSIGFTNDEIIQVCNEIHCSLEENIYINKKNAIYNKLSESKYFLNIYEEKRKNQKQLFHRYLKELGFSLKEDKITIVDIGWKGTIQDCIQRSLPKDCIVNGFYLGLRTKEFGCIDSERKHGLLFSDYPSKCKNYDIFEHGYMFYERIFTANHGPVTGYYLKNDKVVPLINNNPKELCLFNYIKPFQDNLVYAYEQILDLFSNSQWEPYELYDLMLHNFVWKQCVYFPKIWKIEKDARYKSQENFGDISKNERHQKKQIGSEQMKKIDFLFVDYTFRILDKFHMKFLFPLAEIYCRLIYVIKLIKLK